MKAIGDDPVVRYFAKHLVALTGFYRYTDDPVGQPQFCFFSGTLMSFPGIWFFVTAGHALKETDEKLATGKIVMLRWRLNDNFAKWDGKDQGIPFIYADLPRCYIYDETEGLDFGLIPIIPHYRRLLEANGMSAVAEEHWIHQHEVEFDRFMMLGIPEEATETHQLVAEKGVRAIVNATLIPVQAIAHPKDIPAPSRPWFVGQISKDRAPKSIVGMSGGPIFGIKKIDGDERYWVVAIQSWWDKKRRISFGCRLLSFAKEIGEGIAETVAKWKASHTDELK
jgi:hypothetical protein